MKGEKLIFGGGSDLLAFCGHNGLMDFSLQEKPPKKKDNHRDAIVLACYSKEFFKPLFKRTKATPILWTTGLMSPEAYTLTAALDSWIRNETREKIRENAARAYDKYQDCGLDAAKRLLVYE